MFNRALGEILGFFLLCLYIFQPPLHELYNVRSNAVEIVLNQAIAKATSYDNGRFTPEIIEEMKDRLETHFFIRRSDIQFSGTTELTPRGEYISGTLTVRTSPLWLFDGIIGRSPETITRHAEMMSEYLVR